MKKSSVLLILTGGTISMGKEHNDSLSPLSSQQVWSFIPELKNLNINIESIPFDPLIDSSDMNPENWVQICNIIKDNYNRFDGFVVLHGTDTMSYSASAVSFMLENLSKPVIFTGSQLPVGVFRSDAKENLITSIEIAATKTEHGDAAIQEVCLYFEDRLMRGNRTTKRNAEEFDAFASFNYPILAKVGVHIKFFPEYYIKSSSDKKLTVCNELDDRIAILKLFPGINRQTVEAILNIDNLKGLVLETYGAGNAPSSRWFFELLEEANSRGIVVVSVTQCRAGSVEMGIYASSLNLQKAGVVSGYDMTVEAATTKLMHLFGKVGDPQKVKELFGVSIRGEVTV